MKKKTEMSKKNLKEMKWAAIKTRNLVHPIMIDLIGICIIMSVIVSSCYGKGGVYTIEKTIDSLETEIQLDNIINGSYISVDLGNRKFYRGLHERKDLRYLPYLFIVMNEQFLPRPITDRYILMIYDRCGYSLNDSIYELGKVYSVEVMDKYSRLFKPDSINPWRWSYPEHSDLIHEDQSPIVQIEDSWYNLDSLRISVIGYNDRHALDLLKKYYNNIRMGKELAVYYKIMLAFEGNGDLAECYFDVLKPYLEEQPEFYNSIREVLLRAALCDNNERAQKLCDSLGFSLCDYRVHELGYGGTNYVKTSNN